MGTHFETKSDPSRPEKLADLLDSHLDTRGDWQPDELGAILQHQLSADLPLDLGVMPPERVSHLKSLCGVNGLPLNSFGDLFLHPHPPVELLRLVKDFAKSNRHKPCGPIPQEIATVLYYASIAAALAHTGCRITKMRDAGLSAGFAWVKSQPWMVKEVCGLMREAEKKMNCCETKDL